MTRSLLLLTFLMLAPMPGFAESGRWELTGQDSCSIVIIGPAGGSLGGAYRITNTGTNKVVLVLNKCAEKCTPDKQEKGKCWDQCSAEESKDKADKKDEKDKKAKGDKKAKTCPPQPAAPPGICPDTEAQKKAVKSGIMLPAGNSIDLFVGSCLMIEEVDSEAAGGNQARGTTGTYENLSHVSAP